MSPDAAALAVRSAGILVPLLAATALVMARRPAGREWAAAMMSFFWCIATLFPLSRLGVARGWWAFHASGGLLLDIPVDLMLGWSLLWGPIPRLAFPHARLPVVAATAVLFDLHAMPRASPVLVLGGDWLHGEALAIGAVLVPAQLLGTLTASSRAPRVRTAMQGFTFALLVFVLLPAATFEAAGVAPAMPSMPRWLLVIWLQLSALPLLLGVSAAFELATRGEGTPLPWDPPVRLVASGVYGYIASPMQASIVLTFLALTPVGGVLLVLAAASTVAFSVLASWHERTLLSSAMEGFTAYRRAVPALVPRLRPWHPSLDGLRPPARLYVAGSCAGCAPIKAWIERRRPVGLQVCWAEDHPSRDLERITYEPGDGTGDEVGVAAMARAVEHLGLGWALVAALARLPLVRPSLQLLADAVGPGPRRIQRNGAAAGYHLGPWAGPSGRRSCR